MSIEEIKGKLHNYEFFYAGDSGEAYKDFIYLLSIIEQTEKTLTYYAEEPYLESIGYSTNAIEALKAIRGN